MDEKKHRILIVDDEVSIRNALSRLLRHHGYDVATAIDGTRALLRLRKGERFAAMILDLLMPGINGRELVETIAREGLFPLRHIMLLTAVHNADNATAYLQFGCAGYLGKPYANQRVLEQIRRICGGSVSDEGLHALV